MIENNPKFQNLFQNAIEASKYRLVAEVIESKGCHSGHIVGQKLRGCCPNQILILSSLKLNL
jgi:hypothetical protein